MTRLFVFGPHLYGSFSGLARWWVLCAVCMALLCLLWFVLPSRLLPPVTGMNPAGFTRQALPGVINLSGITWHARSNRLWAVTNNPTVLLEIDLQGTVLRKVWLNGFHDTEGVSWLYGNTFAVTEERRCNVAIVEIADAVTQAHYDEAVIWHVPDGCQENNQGLEGIAYDAMTDSLFIAQESKPRRIWVMERVSSDHGPDTARILQDEVRLADVGGDIAGLHWAQAEGRLLAVSEQSRRVSLLDADLRVLQRSAVGSFWQPVRQPEGITRDGEGNVYIVSEPNILVRYRAGG